MIFVCVTFYIIIDMIEFRSTIYSFLFVPPPLFLCSTFLVFLGLFEYFYCIFIYWLFNYVFALFLILVVFFSGSKYTQLNFKSSTQG